MAKRFDATRRWLALAALCVIGVIASTGQTLVSVLLQPIKAELGFSDATIGLVTGIAISIVGGLAAFPIAAAADRYGRALILAASVIAWSIAALTMGFAPSTLVFSIGVIGFNLGDAALLPLLYALVPTLFDDERRHRANAILVATLTACAFGVFAIGGFLYDVMSGLQNLSLTPWRAVFVVTAIAGFLIIPALFLVPKDKSASTFEDKRAASWQAYLQFLREDGKTALLVIAGLSVAYAAYMTTSFWAPAMLSRRFDMSTADAGILLGWALASASLSGIAVAAPVLRRVTLKHGRAATLRVMSSGLAVATLSSLALPIASTAYQFVTVLAVISFAMSFLFTSAPLVLQESAPERFRSRTIAFFPLLALGIRAISLPLIGHASDSRGGDPEALIEAVTFLLGICLPAAALMFWRIEGRYHDFLERQNIIR
ncbi:MAG: MFS transporter [Luminiphilus sp.]